MAENNYRTSLAGFRWANSRTDDSQAQDDEQTPFARLTSSISGYIPLNSRQRTNEEESYLALSRWERFLAALICWLGAAVCFLLAFLVGLPMLAIKPRKFAALFSVGSVLFIVGFAVLQGPLAQAQHMVSAERLPFTAVYLGSLALTLYFAVGQHAYFATLICGLVQIIALVAYLVAYFPGGWTTLQFGGRMAMRGASSLLPV